MGTWDIGFFDNDMACDWENEIDLETDISYIETALKPVINNNEESLDIDLANRALAAAEALARVLGNDGTHSSYTEHLDKWTASYNKEVSIDMLSLALDAIEKVISPDSELRQFWKIRGEYDNWMLIINDLKDRLKS